jgi:hypothetical protein
MKPLLLLDFDSTLFRTLDFWQDFSEIFSMLKHVPAEQLQGHYFDYTVGDGLLRTVDYDAMLADAKLTKGQVQEAVESKLRGKSYLYDDAKQLVAVLQELSKQYDVGILTFGQKDFQQLKIEHEPTLNGIPTFITLELKARYIAANFEAHPSGVLVDDKPGQSLPSGWLEVHIDRTAKHYEKPDHKEVGVIRITSLSDVIDCI